MPPRSGSRRCSRNGSSRSASAAVHALPPRRPEAARRTRFFIGIPLAFPSDAPFYRALDALARAYGSWLLCNDVTRPFWSPGREAGPEREVGMVAFRLGGVVPCLDATLRGT